MQRLFNRTGHLVLDLLVLVGAFGLAFLVHFDGVPPPGCRTTAFVTLPYVVGLRT